MDLFEGFRFSPVASVFFVVVPLLLIGQIVIAFGARSDADDATLAKKYQLATILAIVTALFVFCLLVLAMLFEEIGFSALMNRLASYQGGVVLLARLGEQLLVHAWVGVVLSIAGIVGIGCVGSVWFRHQNREVIFPSPLLAVLAVGLVSVSIGTVWAVREFMMGQVLMSLSGADAGEGRILFSLALQNLPSLSWGLYLSLSILVAILGAVVFVEKKRIQPSNVGSYMMPTGVLVLVFGIAAFVSTRGRVLDVDTRLPVLIGEPFSDWASSKCRNGDNLFPDQGIQLPELDNGSSLEIAPVLVISKDGVVFGGRKMADSEKLKSTELDDIPDLVTAFSALKKKYDQLQPDDAFQGNIILQADVNTTGLVLAKVSTSCRAGGYDRARLAFRRAERFETAVYGQLLRFEHVGVPITLAEKEDQPALDFDETILKWLVRSNFPSQPSKDTKIIVRGPRY